MEVIDSFEALLSNAEVAQVLRENSKIGRGASRPPMVLEMEKRVRKYLEGTPVKNVTIDQVAELYKQLSALPPLVRFSRMLSWSCASW